jgi:hypothetical protein
MEASKHFRKLGLKLRLNRFSRPGPDLRPIVRGDHLPTLCGFWTRRKLQWTHLTEDFLVDAQPGIPSSPW